MGLFKKAKKFVGKQAKNAFDHPLATLGNVALPGAGTAANALLKKAKGLFDGPKIDGPAALPASPFDGVPPVTQDAALRQQQEGQRATGGGVAGAEGDGDFLAEDEVKKRRAARVLLG